MPIESWKAIPVDIKKTRRGLLSHIPGLKYITHRKIEFVRKTPNNNENKKA